MKDYFSTWSLFEKCWLFISVIMLTVASIMWESPWYGYVASISGMICVVLAAKGRISNYWFGIVNCIFYAYVAYGWQLYGEVMLNVLYFLPMQFVGMYLWGKNKDGNKTITVNFISWKNRILGLIYCFIAICLYKELLTAIGGNIPWVDSTSTVLSVVAMILMANVYMEQWVLWILVNIASVIMWVIVVFDQGSNDIGLLIMWVAFLINSLYGFHNWVKMYREQE